MSTAVGFPDDNARSGATFEADMLTDPFAWLRGANATGRMSTLLATPALVKIGVENYDPSPGAPVVTRHRYAAGMT